MMYKKSKGMMIIALCAFGIMAGVSRLYTGGYEVKADGRIIGYVDNLDDVEEIVKEFDEEIFEGYGIDNQISDKIEISKKVDLKYNITDKNKLKENVSSLSELITDGYILVVNGEKTIAFDSFYEMYTTVMSLKNLYMIDNSKTNFCEEIEFVKEYVNNTEIYDKKSAIEYLKENKILNVKSVVKSSYKGSVDFEVIKKEDNTLYEGDSKVIKEGEAGEKTITAMVSYVNGEEVQREVISEKVIKEPIAQIENVGTLKKPNLGDGFIYPLNVRISSFYGERWGRLHGGIDLAAKEGTPIKASDGGEVVFSAYSGSYGLLVKIDHGNGYMTYYAHCSELKAKVGDKVSKGDVIALVGNTGNSTGPHCHFEIRYDNKQLDPMEFLK